MQRVAQPWPPVVWPSRAEWVLALRPLYWTFTALVALSLAGSFVPYREVVRYGHPWLPRKRCSGCPFCGMTRSFCAMSAGRWQSAYRWNLAGPALYCSGWLWLGLGAFTLARPRAR